MHKLLRSNRLFFGPNFRRDGFFLGVRRWAEDHIFLSFAFSRSIFWCPNSAFSVYQISKSAPRQHVFKKKKKKKKQKPSRGRASVGQYSIANFWIKGVIEYAAYFARHALHVPTNIFLATFQPSLVPDCGRELMLVR